MTKEELYTAIETVHDRGLEIANDIRDAEQNYTGDELTAKLDEIKFLKINSLLVGEDTVKENAITLCNMISENG